MALKAKFRTLFPALVTTASPLTRVKNGLIYAFGFDVNAPRDSLDGLHLSALEPRRAKLTDDRTYYVRTDGSDSNNGLANTSGGAWATIQHGIDFITNSLDFAGYNVTLQVGDGEYNDEVSVVDRHVGKGTFAIRGDLTTPANVLISTAKGCFTLTDGADIDVRGLKIESASSYGFFVTRKSKLVYADINFGDVAMAHIWCTDHAETVKADGRDEVISGGGEYHWLADTLGIIFAFDGEVTAIDAPDFSIGFAVANINGIVESSGVTFRGSVTGRRYSASTGGRITTGTGGSKTYFPGDQPGIVADGGIYDLVPRFHVHKNGTSQTGITGGVENSLTWSTEAFDVGGYFDFNVWTPPAGTVVLHATAQFTGGLDSDNPVSIEITRDGTAIKTERFPFSTSQASISISTSIIDVANGSNAYGVRVRADGSTSKTVAGTAAQTNFWGYML